MAVIIVIIGLRWHWSWIIIVFHCHAGQLNCISEAGASLQRWKRCFLSAFRSCGRGKCLWAWLCWRFFGNLSTAWIGRLPSLSPIDSIYSPSLLLAINQRFSDAMVISTSIAAPVLAPFRMRWASSTMAGTSTLLRSWPQDWIGLAVCNMA